MWLRLKVGVANGLCRPAVGRWIGVLLRDQVPYRGLTIATGDRHILPEVKARLFWGFYEKAECEMIQRHLPPDLDVIELGASLGVISCQIRKRLNRERILICVEANPSLIQIIRANLERNRLTQNVTLLERAVYYSDPPKDFVLFECQAANTSGHTLQAQASDAAVAVRTTTLAEIVQSSGLKEFAIVCDIEGAECAMIDQELAVLGRCKKLIIELHNKPELAKHCCISEMRSRLIAKHGFTLQDCNGHVFVFGRS